MNNFREEFPDYPAEDMPPIPAGFDDCSWRNEACPCFFNEPLELELWIDYPKAEDREFPEMERFGLRSRSGDYSLYTDDWSIILSTIEAATKFAS